MKLYNPFKPHLVQFANGKFAMRRLRLLGFEYMDKWPEADGRIFNYWWPASLIPREEMSFSTAEEAKATLRNRIERDSGEPHRVTKVIP